MNPSNFSADDFRKGTGDNRLTENFTECVRIVDVLCALSHSEYSNLLRQMGGCEQPVSLLIGRDGLSKIGIILTGQKIVAAVIMINPRAP